MADRITKQQRSELMSHIRGKNTKLERVVFTVLRHHGIYFQKHYRRAVGTPDIAIPSRKIAVFIDGDFWHGYRYPAWKNKLRKKFWRDKIERNRARDKRTFAKLRRDGWRVLRVWEHELKKERESTIRKIVSFMKRKP